MKKLFTFNRYFCQVFHWPPKYTPSVGCPNLWAKLIVRQNSSFEVNRNYKVCSIL